MGICQCSGFKTFAHLWLHFSSEGPHTSSTSTPTGSRASLSVTWSCKAMCGSASGEEGQGLDGPQPVALAHVGTQVMSCRSLGPARLGKLRASTTQMSLTSKASASQEASPCQILSVGPVRVKVWQTWER